jgi:purine-nucleoside phosphorylase
MSEYYSLEQIDRIANDIRLKTSVRPEVGIILGSGLGATAKRVEDPIIIPYNEIPDWPTSTVIGHQGQLVVGKFENKEVFVLQGRVHYYEGYSLAQIALPVRVLQRLGMEVLIVTNAAGAVNPKYVPGDLMLINDHINLIGMAGLGRFQYLVLQPFASEHKLQLTALFVASVLCIYWGITGLNKKAK